MAPGKVLCLVQYLTIFCFISIHTLTVNQCFRARWGNGHEDCALCSEREQALKSIELSPKNIDGNFPDKVDLFKVPEVDEQFWSLWPDQQSASVLLSLNKRDSKLLFEARDSSPAAPKFAMWCPFFWSPRSVFHPFRQNETKYGNLLDDGRLSVVRLLHP